MRGNRLPAAGTAVALALLAAAVFWPARDAGFYIVDDGLYVLANDRVRQGLSWSGAGWAFGSVGYASNWHPAAWLSHMADVELFGLDPRGHHLTSVLLHAAVSALLFLALRGLTGSTWRSAAAAALHAAHPLRVESVVWIAERKDLLAAFFWMAGLLAWGRYVRRPGPGRYGAVAACHVLGLLSKPMMVTFPLVLLVLDWWPLRRVGAARGATGARTLRQAVLEKAPLLLLSCAGGVMTLVAQGATVVPLARIPAAARVATPIQALAHYLEKALWPVNLAAFYQLDGPAGPGAALAGTAMVAAVSLLAWRLRRQAAQIAAGWVWFLVTLLPVLGLIRAGWQAAADRYTYIPLTGAFIAVVWSIPVPSRRGLRRLAAFLLVPAVAALVPVTRAQIGFWRDSETLLRRTLAVTGANWFAHLQLGKVLTGKSRLEEAEAELRKALAIHPDLPEGHRGIGAIRLLQGQAREAGELFRRAATARPGDPAIWYDLGTALAAAGSHDEAASSFRRAVTLEPRTEVLWWSLQGELALAGRVPEARQVLARALELFPASPELHTDAGVLAAGAGDLRQAGEHFTRALQLRPGDEGARRNLARLDADPRWRRPAAGPGGAGGDR